MKSSEKGPAYRIETDRLVLRCWCVEDSKALRALLDKNAQHLRPHIPFMKNEPRSLAQTGQWLREIRASFDLDKHYRYAVLNKEDEVLMGEIMFIDREDSGQREMGYWLGEEFCGKGYITEAAAVMSRVGLEIENAPRVEIHCDEENGASANIPRKLGYSLDGILRARAHRSDSSKGNLMIWSLFPDQLSQSIIQESRYKAWNSIGEEIE